MEHTLLTPHDDVIPPTEEHDGGGEEGDMVKNKSSLSSQQFQFDVGSPMSLKEFQERAL